MRAKWSSLVLLVSVVACGGGSAAAPRSTAQVREVKPVSWQARTAATPLWAAGTKQVQIVVTQARVRGIYHVWVVGDGDKPEGLYCTSDVSLPRMMNEVFSRIARQPSSPRIAVWYGGPRTTAALPPPPVRVASADTTNTEDDPCDAGSVSKPGTPGTGPIKPPPWENILKIVKSLHKVQLEMPETGP